jgi:hypothetical protein
VSPDLLEAAARELCRMRGYEPDAPAHYPLEPIGTCWEQMRTEVERFAQVGTAIAAVLHAGVGSTKKPLRPRAKPP